MKYFYCGLIILISFFMTSYNSYSFAINNCLEMVYPHGGGYYNPDSVMVDTCLQSPTFNKWYSKRGYEFQMKLYVFGGESLPFDTTVTWEDISSTFTQIKDGFQSLEQQFGPYTIKRSDFYTTDSMFLEHPTFALEFQDYFEVDSVSQAIHNIDSIYAVWLKHKPGFYYSIEDNNIEREDVIKIEFINNNFLKIILIENLFSLNNFIKIYRLDGILILQIPLPNTNELSIDISTWAKGVYLVNIGKYSKIIII